MPREDPGFQRISTHASMSVFTPALGFDRGLCLRPKDHS